MIIYLEPKWPLFWLEKALFWRVDLQNRGQLLGSRYISIYNHFQFSLLSNNKPKTWLNPSSRLPPTELHANSDGRIWKSWLTTWTSTATASWPSRNLSSWCIKWGEGEAFQGERWFLLGFLLLVVLVVVVVVVVVVVGVSLGVRYIKFYARFIMNQHWPTKFGLCWAKMQMYRSPDGKKNIVDGPTKPRVKIEGWTNSPKSVCFVLRTYICGALPNKVVLPEVFFFMVIVCWPFLFSVERDRAFERLWKSSFTISGLKVAGRTRFGEKLSHTWHGPMEEGAFLCWISWISSFSGSMLRLQWCFWQTFETSLIKLSLDSL